MTIDYTVLFLLLLLLNDHFYIVIVTNYSIMTCACLCHNSRLFSVHAEPTPVQVLPTALNLRSDLRGVRSTDINGVVHVVLVVSDSNISQSHVSAVGPQTGEAEEDGATAGLVNLGNCRSVC